MSVLRSKAFRSYLLGIASVTAGAAMTEATGSMLPLAMGSAAALMWTAGLVRQIRERARAARSPRE